MTPRIDVRLAIPVAVAWVTLVASLPTPRLLGGIAVTACVLTVVALTGAIVAGRCPVRPAARRTAAALALLALACGCAGAVSGAAALRAPHRLPEALVAQTGRTLQVEGRSLDRVVDGTRAATIAIDSARSGDAVVWSGSTSILVFAPRADAPVEIGDRVVVRVTLLPGGDGESVALLARAAGELSVVASASGPTAWAGGLRASFRAVTADLPGDGGDLLPGLTIGDTTAVTDELDGAMKATGLSHLTAVSGSNCAVLVALALLVGTLCRLPRLARIVGAAVALCGFVVLVTPEPSVLRAAVMAIVLLAQTAAGRPSAGVPLLAVAVLVLLLHDPWLARDYAFALSVLATAGLIVLAGPLTRLLSTVVPEPVAMVLAVPTAAQLACQPVLLLLEPSVPVHGVVANVLAGPAAPVATVLGLVVCVLAPWAPSLATTCAAVAWAPSAWVAAVSRSVAEWPGGRVEWPGGVLGVVAWALLAIVVAVAVLAGPRSRLGRAAVAVIVVGVLVVTAALAGVRLGRGASRPDDWVVAQCDVGQGDAVLVRDAGRVALLDVGDDEGALRRCLDDFGVGGIDLLVLTHFDRDHVGAVGVVADRVGTAVVGPTGRPADGEVVSRLADAGAAIVPAAPGVGGVLGALPWSVVWPGDDVAPGNDASVVVVFGGPDCPRCVSFVDLGDVGAGAQRRLLRAGDDDLGRLAPVDVVKMSHHGSADQDADLYRALAPSTLLVGVGADNGYGHPTAAALSLADEIGATVTRSDTDGAAALVVDADGTRSLWRERSVSPAARRLDVDAATTATSEEDHGDARGRQDGEEDERRHRPGRLGPHPSGQRDPRQRARAVPGRPRRASVARPAGG